VKLLVASLIVPFPFFFPFSFFFPFFSLSPQANKDDANAIKLLQEEAMS